MFSALRIILIVGAIFYYSPVRQTGNEGETLERLLQESGTESATAAPAEGASSLDALWEALPESAKQSIVDRIVASVLGPEPDRTREALLQPPTDTLEPEDFQPAWQGMGKPQPQS